MLPRSEFTARRIQSRERASAVRPAAKTITYITSIPQLARRTSGSRDSGNAEQRAQWVKARAYTSLASAKTECSKSTGLSCYGTGSLMCSTLNCLRSRFLWHTTMFVSLSVVWRRGLNCEAAAANKEPPRLGRSFPCPVPASLLLKRITPHRRNVLFVVILLSQSMVSKELCEEEFEVMV